MKLTALLASTAILAISLIAANASPGEREHKGDDHRYEQQDQREAYNREDSSERDHDRSKDGERYDREDNDDHAGNRRDHDRD